VEKTDKQFFLTFLGVTGLLVFLTVVVLVAANLVGTIGSPDEKSAAQIKMAEQRIQPIGKVNLKSSPVRAVAQVPAATATAAAADTDGQDTGSRVFESICQVCHMAGVAGAPIAGNRAAWEPRIAKGIEALYASALKGKGAMPPKGGNPALSDAEVKAAVDYMLKLSSP
jgi:cytochrome c5